MIPEDEEAHTVFEHTEAWHHFNVEKARREGYDSYPEDSYHCKVPGTATCLRISFMDKDSSGPVSLNETLGMNKNMNQTVDIHETTNKTTRVLRRGAPWKAAASHPASDWQRSMNA